ncbi:MAG: DUF4349 domain-containing protein [Gemmatimonadales bacterium]
MNHRPMVGWILLGALAGCGGVAMSRDAAAPADEASSQPGRAISTEDAPAPALAARSEGAEGRPGQPDRMPTQMIIRTGAVSIEVDSVEVAVRQVAELATRSGGFVANSSIQTGENDPRTAMIEIRVPADRYDGTLDGLRAVGEVKSASTNTQDVGEEFVDVTARVTNAKKLEDRLLTLLATRTGKLEDVLSVERELARVREEIERFEGRLRYLTTKVSMSTIAVTVFEPGPLVGQPGENVILDALRQSWRNFVGVIASAIAMAGGLLPILVLAVAGVWLARRWWRGQQAPPAA